MKPFFIIKVLLIACLACPLFCSISWAQSSRLFKVQTGEVPVQVLPKKAQYRFDDFRWGKVTFMDGQTAKAKLNYNLLYGEMQFIDRSNDTLSIADDPTVKFLVVNNTTFHYYPTYGYMEEITDFSTCKLAGKQRLNQVRIKDLGANGSASDFFRRSNNSTLNQHPRFLNTNMSLTEEELYHQAAVKPMVLAIQKAYYFMDFNQRWYPANRANVKRVFRSHKEEVLEFVDTERINFNEVQDLTKLLRFCDDLKNQDQQLQSSGK